MIAYTTSLGRLSSRGLRFGIGSEFGFENHLRFFNLRAPPPKTDPPQVRHTLGLGPVPTKNSIHDSISTLGTVPAQQMTGDWFSLDIQ